MPDEDKNFCGSDLWFWIVEFDDVMQKLLCDMLKATSRLTV